jgi:uncharacterized delta-60 repeat protein
MELDSQKKIGVPPEKMNLLKTVCFAAALLITSTLAVTAQTCPGCLDPTFNAAGSPAGSLVVPTFGSGGTGQRDSVLQSDGKIVSLVDEKTTQITLVRANTDGTLDSGFGTGGVVKTNWHHSTTAPYGFAYGLAIQTIEGQQRLVVAGSWTVPQGRSNVTMLRVDRYMPDGTVDTSFGTNGTVLVNKPYAIAVAIQPQDQKIVTVGDLQAVVRLHPNGSVDTSFGQNGDGATGAGQSGWSIIALPGTEGGILVGGTYSTKGGDMMTVTKLKMSGAVDTAFGIGGRAIADFFGRGSFGRAFRMDIDLQGNILAGGIARPKGASIAQNRYAAARFLPNGVPDTYFGGDGTVTYDFAGMDNDGRGINAQQDDGKVILSGSAQVVGTGRDFAAVRLNNNGTVDTSFGTNGRVVTDLGGTSEYSYSSHIWVDPGCGCQKLILAGGTNIGAIFLRYTL